MSGSAECHARRVQGTGAFSGGEMSGLAAVSGGAPPEVAGFAASLTRLAKPGIVIAEVMTGLAGMVLVAPGLALNGATMLALVAITLAAAGAAMLNGVLDAAADRVMPRLAARCQAMSVVGSGRILTIGVSLMGAGIALAALCAPPLAPVLLAIGCFTYLWLYTAWLKRRSPWGVLAGGIPGALPPLVGAAAVSGGLTVPSLLLAFVIYIWQLPHFWLLALDCRDQYARAGVPVLPLTHGVTFTKILTLAASLLLLPASMILGTAGHLSLVYSIIAGLAGVVFPLCIARCLCITHNYRRGFIASQIYLMVIVGAICCEPLLRHW